jgi:O-acetyl-ADP-ribose deacetylase
MGKGGSYCPKPAAEAGLFGAPVATRQYQGWVHCGTSALPGRAGCLTLTTMAASSPGLVEVVQGDITTIRADAIVNAANSALKAGGGVCGAIFHAAGADVLTRACDAIGHCPTGEAVITPAFGIKTAHYIIHAVGPAYSAYPPEEARELLRSAYSSAIRLAAAHGCRSIAFPAISTGIYGYPLDEACREAANVCRTESDADGLTIKLVAFDAKTAAELRIHLQPAGQ